MHRGGGWLFKNVVKLKYKENKNNDRSIWKIMEDKMPQAILKMFTNQKLWVDTTIHVALWTRTTTDNTDSSP